MKNKKSLKLPTCLFIFCIILNSVSLAEDKNVYNFEANLISGKKISLSEFEGKVLLMVNTASLCGYTKQYASLQKLYDRYKDQGFEILAFPSNDFGKQEPGNDEEIAKFCDLKFKVQFPLFSKIVVKNEGMHPIYQWLTQDEKLGGDIRWNFTKFIINAKGELVARYESSVDPLDVVIIEQIDLLIAEKASNKVE